MGRAGCQYQWGEGCGVLVGSLTAVLGREVSNGPRGRLGGASSVGGGGTTIRQFWARYTDERPFIRGLEESWL